MDNKRESGLVNTVYFKEFKEDMEDSFSENAIKALYNHFRELFKDNPVEYYPNDIISQWEEFSSIKNAGESLYDIDMNDFKENDMFYQISSEFDVIEMDCGGLLVKIL